MIDIFVLYFGFLVLSLVICGAWTIVSVALWRRRGWQLEVGRARDQVGRLCD